MHILKGHVSKDHVHLLVSIPPQVTISRLVQRLKGKTAYKMLQEFAAAAEAVLGPAPVGAGVLLLQQRERDGRGGGGVHREPGAAGPEDFRVEHGDFSPPRVGAFEPTSGGGLRAHLGWEP